MAQRALAVPEILHSTVIFSICHADEVGYPSRNKRAYRLARVSRAFFQVAIPFVWEEVVVENLVKLIPFVRECLRGRLTGRFKFKTNLEKYDLKNWTNAELSRLHFYGPFVKRLHRPWSYHDHHINRELFETPVGARILQYLATYVILPNLQEFSTIFDDNASLIDWRLCLVSASLRRFDTSRGQKEFPLVDAVIKRCPGLETLHLRGDFNHADRSGPTPTFSQLSLPLALRDLDLQEQFLCHDLLGWTCKLPLLQRLKFTEFYQGSWAGLDSSIPTNPYLFAALTVLDIGWDARAVTLIRACRFPNLAELSLNLWNRGIDYDNPDLQVFTSLVTQYCPTITKLTARVVVDPDGKVAEWLGKLRSLRLSQLCIGADIVVDESEFDGLNERISEYWPNLEHLGWHCDYLNLQMVANALVLFPSLRSFVFDALHGPWVRPSSGVSSISTEPLVLVCELPTRNGMKIDELTSWLSYIRPGIRCDIYLPPVPPELSASHSPASSP